MSDRVAANRPRYALAARRAGAVTAIMLGATVLLLLMIVSLARAAVPADLSPVWSSAAPDLADPLITHPTITETSDYLHAEGLTLYYGDGMPAAQDFWIGGQAEGDDLEVITCTAAFGEPPFDDWDPYVWTCGPYSVESTDSGTVEITATLYNTTGTTDVALFTCLEDTADPASAADSPAYANASPIPVTYTVEADLSGLDHVRLHYRYESGAWTMTEYTSTATSGVFNFVPEDGDGTYYFQTVARDNVGNSEPEPSSGDGDTHTIYDTTAPTSSASSPTYDNGGSIPVGFAADDATSLVAQTCLWYRYQSGAWTPSGQCLGGTSGTFSFSPTSGDGTYGFQTLATDNAGNLEAIQPGDDDSTIYDTTDPTASVSSPEVSNELSWLVSWEGDDQALGSGIASYDVQYRVDGGLWQDWLMGTGLTSHTFGPDSPELVAFEHTYDFRVRARDEAGNVGGYSGYSPAASTYVDYYRVYIPQVLRAYSLVTNGGFEDGWAGWAHGGALSQAIISNDGWSGPHSGSYAARLGDPSYACNGGVPLGTAWIERTIAVPSRGVSTLQIHYNIYSQDKLSDPKYDRFEIWVEGSLEWMDGILTDPYGCGTAPRTTGWRVFNFDVTGYQGTSITLRLQNVSGFDNWYNTWTYVDDIQLLP
jgi:hypothetical protein